MLGHKIRELRRENKLSQFDLGQKINLDQTLISRIERGTRKVTSDEIKLLANALNVSVSELLEKSA